MKWIFLAAIVVLTPLLAFYLRNNRQHVPKAAFLLALLPFFEAKFNIVASPYTWRLWQGFVKGVDISLIDCIAIAMIYAGIRVKTPLRIKLTFSAYIIVFVISTLAAEIYVPSIFYGWQILRVVLVYYAVSRAAADQPDVPRYLLSGLIMGVTIQACVVTIEKLGGVSQAGGWFGHQNLLGMASHFAVYPSLAVFLAGYCIKRTGLGLVAALVVAWAGGSRATIGLMCLGIGLTIIFSCWRRSSFRKIAIAAVSAALLAASAPILYSAIERRSAEVRADSSAERNRMTDAATMIAVDYPLGVGANRFVSVANVGGYYARAGLVWTSAAAPVHNTYYLVAAEMGLIGLAAFLSIIIASISLSIGVSRRLPPSFGAEYALGATIVLVVVAAHAYVEWIIMLYSIHALFAMMLGVLVALRASVDVKPVVARSRERLTQSATGSPAPA